MRIFSIDSTSKTLSVAVSDGDKILSFLKNSKSTTYMVNIIKYIDKALNESGLEIKDIDIFAVNLGPGDFTGGRIGISIIKTFSFLSKKPVYGFNSLDVFALGFLLKNIEKINKVLERGNKAFIAPLMDVRNKELYFSIYEAKRVLKKNINNKNLKVYEKLIFSFVKNDYFYLLQKTFDNTLLNQDNFLDGFFSIVNRVRCLTNTTTCAPSLENNEKFQKQTSIFYLTGNAFKTFEEQLSELKEALTKKEGAIKIKVDKFNYYPEARFLNLLANFKYENKIPSLPIIPIYVRDFIPFSKEKK